MRTTIKIVAAYIIGTITGMFLMCGVMSAGNKYAEKEW